MATIQIGSTIILGAVDGGGTIWRINQDGVTGFGSPPTTMTPVQRPRGRGATVGDTFDQGRIITITGTITTTTPTILNSSVDRLKAAVTREPFQLGLTETGRTQNVVVRRQGETLISKVTNVHAKFSVQLFAPDPRLLGVPLVATTTEQATSGGYIFPHIFPLTITSTISAGLISFTNPGSEVGPVLARIDGPCRGPIITHLGVGAPTIFSLTGLNLVSGEFLLINMDAKTVLGNGTASRSLYVTSRAWSGFDPGVNVWTFNAVTADPTALLTITATPAN